LSFSTRRRRFHRRRPWVKKSFFFEEIFESFLDFERWANACINYYYVESFYNKYNDANTSSRERCVFSPPRK